MGTFAYQDEKLLKNICQDGHDSTPRNKTEFKPYMIPGGEKNTFISVSIIKTGKPSVFDCTVQQMQCSKCDDVTSFAVLGAALSLMFCQAWHLEQTEPVGACRGKRL